MQDASTPQHGNPPQSPPSTESDELRSKWRLDLEIALLEAELDLKRRQSHRLRITKITESDIESVCDPELSCNADLVALVVRAEEIKQRIAVEFPDPVTCHYDHPKALLITVHYPDRPSVTIDILESLKADPNNLAHPQIAGAIAHYARMARKQAKSARHNLERVLTALLHKKQRREEDRLKAVATSIYLNSLPGEYFDRLWKILRSNEAVNLDDNRDKRPWLNHIRKEIQSEYPEVDHRKILAFLRRYPLLIPRHSGGQPAGAFKNAILSCKLNLDPDSIKTVRSSNSLYRMSQNPFSETEWEQLADSFVDTLTADLTKTSTIRPYEDFSNLETLKYDPSK